MDRTNISSNKGGFSLIEVTIAMAIFMVVLGTSAQMLLNFNSTLDTEHQRVIALQHCSNVLTAMRTLRETATNNIDTPKNYQTAVVAAYPNNSAITAVPASWAPLLKNETILVTYADTQGDPLVPTVKVTWTGPRSHSVSVQVSTALTPKWSFKS